MLNTQTLRSAMGEIAAMMAAQRQHLIELDQRNGDGDLGISMADGFAAASAFVNSSEETDLGKLLVKYGRRCGSPGRGIRSSWRGGRRRGGVRQGDSPAAN